MESLRVARDCGALKKSDLARITVDTTGQPKNVPHPTDAKPPAHRHHRSGGTGQKNWACRYDSLCAGGKANGRDGRSLSLRQAVQAAQQDAEVSVHSPGPLEALHPAQDRGGQNAGRRLCPLRWPNRHKSNCSIRTSAGASSTPGIGRKPKCIGKSKAHSLTRPAARSPSPPTADARVGSSCSTPKLSRAIPTTDTP